MLKTFLKTPSPSETTFWDDYFGVQSFDYLVRLFDVDPLRPLFEEFCAHGALVLEGGCGLGNYLACIAGLGGRPIGLDFGFDLLTHVHRRVSRVPLTAGDVTKLPFQDEAFDAYYSGGVVEHFEEGPRPALIEARRVLKRGGTLLISVPYENPLRRISAKWAGDAMVVERVSAEASGAAPPGHNFFEYQYRSGEFRRHLTEVGFEVVREQPYSMWRGLALVPPFRWIDRAYASMAAKRPQVAAAVGITTDTNGQKPRATVKSRLRYLMFAEDRGLPVIGPVIAGACELASNMRMFVCRRP